MPDPLIITVAPNGARKLKTDHAALPISPDELAQTAADCLEAGAAMIHLHVRDEEGRHSLDVEAYRAAIRAVRNRVGKDLIIQATTESVGIYNADQQMVMVRELAPEAVSLAIREICPGPAMEEKAAAFFTHLRDAGIFPQYILYSKEDIRYFRDLLTSGVIPDPGPHVLFVLGRYSPGMTSDPSDLLPFLAAADGMDCDWSVCAFGALEGACALTAAGLGGHCRVGFENNLLLADGTIAPDNAALVAQVGGQAGFMGRSVASAAEARKLLGMG
ncbi:3-keto-5-aminohexanoate cleavage protein [Aestuariispira insulae]|uniref:Uncharacterized protein (DUF849 family) n=1 Tax=Aestuariispira insulae TaxID=1461337 RepID=A0A3D9HHZ5_9PROT|nr:3-keto-5-aminohexanoate cleavage protein [Aestuariispira insulae]RED49162.1 uncharacterized protein (DUF849 family) [Aestuariispira insulae]